MSPMQDLLDAACTLVLFTSAVVCGFIALSSVLAWVVGLFQGDLAVIVGALPMAAVFAAVSRFSWRMI